MVSPASNSQHVGIVIEAQDRASRTIRNISQNLRQTLGSSIRSAAISMISFTSILSAVGLSITGIVVLMRNWVGGIVNTNRAMGRLGVTLRSSGFSAEATNARLQEMRNNLSALTLQTLPGLERAMLENFLSLMPESQKEIELAAKQLSELAGIDYTTAFNALNEGLNGNLKPLTDLGIEGETFGEKLADIQARFEWLLENEGALASFWRSFKEGLGDAGVAVRDIATALGEAIIENDALRRVATQLALGIWAPFVEFFRAVDGVQILQAIRDAIVALTEGDENAARNAGLEIGKAMASGIFGFFLGDFGQLLIDTTKQAFLALTGEDSDLKGFLGEIGRKVGEWFWGGLKNFIAGPFAPLLNIGVVDAFTDSIGRAIADFFQGGWDLAKSFGSGLLDGLKSALQQAADFMVNQVNNIIRRFNAAMGRFGVRIDTIDRIVIGNTPALREADVSGLREAGTGRTAIQSGSPLTIVLNGREVARAQMEIINGELRIRQPGLAIN